LHGGLEVHIAATCDICHDTQIFDKPGPATAFVHCERRERIPQKVMEQFYDARDASRRRFPIKREPSPNLYRGGVRWI
jgi:hypothetical protein